MPRFSVTVFVPSWLEQDELDALETTVEDFLLFVLQVTFNKETSVGEISTSLLNNPCRTTIKYYLNEFEAEDYHLIRRNLLVILLHYLDSAVLPIDPQLAFRLKCKLKKRVTVSVDLL